ncbi:uncharacterized protein EV422DRAFT_572499 [Fimicolochytrium jonesii]|uniref:uncharacterized protein n=1 Tax=Fimicolochytrium jonesii TaxID=1396493 RepID=UPI0022FE3931|nr:uncharacterized protein EV422DRAFT_572499 [Fimicolochytrium jonesii]KAI8815686.1 hypothetical protein EV422DRAFT_572499 [Fimicolochytrium jonesii]
MPANIGGNKATVLKHNASHNGGLCDVMMRRFIQANGFETFTIQELDILLRDALRCVKTGKDDERNYLRDLRAARDRKTKERLDELERLNRGFRRTRRIDERIETLTNGTPDSSDDEGEDVGSSGEDDGDDDDEYVPLPVHQDEEYLAEYVPPAIRQPPAGSPVSSGNAVPRFIRDQVEAGTVVQNQVPDVMAAYVDMITQTQKTFAESIQNQLKRFGDDIEERLPKKARRGSRGKAPVVENQPTAETVEDAEEIEDVEKTAGPSSG